MNEDEKSYINGCPRNMSVVRNNGHRTSKQLKLTGILHLALRISHQHRSVVAQRFKRLNSNAPATKLDPLAAERTPDRVVLPLTG